MDRDAQSLGRVREFRCHVRSTKAIDEPAISQLLCGGGGLQLRLGVYTRKVIKVDWSDVTALQRGKLWAAVEKPEE
jgi:hypothetical protein